MKTAYKVTVDGPAGAGKSTVAKMVAEKASLLYLDTGAMYRCVALIAHNTGADPASAAETLHFEIVYSEGCKHIISNGIDVTSDIRTPLIDRLVSETADNMAVRRTLVKKQRELARNKRVILDGRDTGTVVFPDADIKFYLDASVEVRAERRLKESVEKGFHTDFETLRLDIIRRDDADRSREWGALKIPDDAIVVDTGNMSVEEVVEKLLYYIGEDED